MDTRDAEMNAANGEVEPLLIQRLFAEERYEELRQTFAQAPKSFSAVDGSGRTPLLALAEDPAIQPRALSGALNWAFDNLPREFSRSALARCLALGRLEAVADALVSGSVRGLFSEPNASSFFSSAVLVGVKVAQFNRGANPPDESLGRIVLLLLEAGASPLQHYGADSSTLLSKTVACGTPEAAFACAAKALSPAIRRPGLFAKAERWFTVKVIDGEIKWALANGRDKIAAALESAKLEFQLNSVKPAASAKPNGRL